MISLADIFGLRGSKARKFNFAINELESKIHSGSISAKIMADIFRKSTEILLELGFSDVDVLPDEAFAALKNKFLGDKILVNEDEFWKKFSNRCMVLSGEIISIDPDDIERNIELGGADFVENFRQKLRLEIIEKYHEKLPKFSKKSIENKLF